VTALAMGIASMSILPPSAQHVGLIPPLIAFLLLLHLPFIGVLLVSSGLSLLARRRNAPLADDLMSLATPRGVVFVFLGALPLVCLTPLLAQLHHGASFSVARALIPVMISSLLAQGLLYAYRRRNRLILAGQAGFALLAAAYLLLFEALTLLNAPESWDFPVSLLPRSFWIEAPTRFGSFIVAATCLTGAMILFVYFHFTERRLPEDAPHGKPLLLIGASALLAGALAAPPFLIATLLFSRAPMLGNAAFVLASAIIVLLAPIAVVGTRTLLDVKARHTTATLSFACAVLALVTLLPFVQQFTANRDVLLRIKEDAAKRFAEARRIQESLYPKVEADPALGEKVFAERCSACHAWDRRVVGPPYQSVLLKYRGRADALAAFVRQPVRVDPAYPPMPAPGLTEAELVSIVRYLLDENARRQGEVSPQIVEIQRQQGEVSPQIVEIQRQQGEASPKGRENERLRGEASPESGAAER
jgi:cytochrome c